VAKANGYLRIGELARRTGTSPELLRAWEQRYGLLRPSRSAGGFRLYSDDDKARILRTKQLIASGVMREVLLPYLRILGDRWARGEVSVAQEHFASALLRGRLLGLARGWGTGSGPTLILACPPGEQHDLGLIMFGIAASRRGRRITYLGQDTPFSTIEATIDAVGPELVVFAVAEGTSLGQHARAIRALAKRAPVAVGGAGTTEDEARRLGARFLEGDPIEAAGALTS